TAAPSAPATAASTARMPPHMNPTVLALTAPRSSKAGKVAATPTLEQLAAGQAASCVAVAPQPAPSYDALASLESLPTCNQSTCEDEWSSQAAREAVVEHMAAPRAPVLAAAGEEEVEAGSADPVEAVREATLTPLASNEVKAAFAEFLAPPAPVPVATEAMGNELKTLRRMLETQLAHLAWNDLTRRAPVHAEILRELTEIGLTQDLAEHLVRQLPEDTELTFARRFTIAGFSQYLKVTGDRWLDEGGRVAFTGATGVGKT